MAGTETVATQIRAFLKAHPQSTQQEIAVGTGHSRAHVALELSKMDGILKARRPHRVGERPRSWTVYSAVRVATVDVRLGGFVRCPVCETEFGVRLT